MVTRHIQRLWQAVESPHLRLPPTLSTHRSGGTNLEIFKFGMYIMFPIGWMYYFGVNLDTRFSVPDFWPSPETTHKIPFDKEELKELSERLKAERLEKKRRRLERERLSEMGDGESSREGRQSEKQVAVVEQRTLVAESSGKFGVGSIERWARGNKGD